MKDQDLKESREKIKIKRKLKNEIVSKKEEQYFKVKRGNLDQTNQINSSSEKSLKDENLKGKKEKSVIKVIKEKLKV